MPEKNIAKQNMTEQELKDEEMIQQAFQKLLDTYLTSNHRRKTDIITKAFNFAKSAHHGVRRLSGEPYILHPIAVAQIVAEEIGLGSTSICAALLHDVEEDTDYSNEDIANLFGQKIANIVEGLTKISGGVFGDKASLQAETFKKLLLTMSDDIRVILIKIADRVHNMRTLQSMRPEKQYKIAGETIYIYAPIADRLGLNKIKNELEDLSFRYEHPEEYASIAKLIAESQPERDVIFDEFTAPIRKMLDEMDFKYEIKARIKTPYSVWMKMKNKHVAFTEIYDILAIRIIFTPKSSASEKKDIHEIYGGLTEIYKAHPTRYRDWVSNPKANGYQALHNTFKKKQGEGQWIEVQIRSNRMEEIAEKGIAAHWKYKAANASYDEGELDRWLSSIREILDDPQPDTLDFLDTIKLNLFASEIMVFTPKGEIRTMPLNSTVLDFAFSIHSALGTHCMGAKVNHKTVPNSYRLKSGDLVEIITSESVKVDPSWLDNVTTAKARGKVQAILRRQCREFQKQGNEMVKAFLVEKDFDPTTPIIDKLTRYHAFKNHNELFQFVGDGSVVLGQEDIDYLRGRKRYKGWKRFVPFIHDKVQELQAPSAIPDDFVKNINRKKVLELTDEIVEKCILAECCHPIPEDDTLGFINDAGKLELHQRSCPVTLKLKSQYGNNIIATQWKLQGRATFPAVIRVTGIDSDGVLYAIANVLHKKLKYPISRISLDTKDHIFHGEIMAHVRHTREIDEICEKLLQVENVTEATRAFK